MATAGRTDAVYYATRTWNQNTMNPGKKMTANNSGEGPTLMELGQVRVNFQGNCFTCGYWGHRSCDCPQRARGHGRGFGRVGNRSEIRQLDVEDHGQECMPMLCRFMRSLRPGKQKSSVESRVPAGDVQALRISVIEGQEYFECMHGTDNLRVSELFTLSGRWIYKCHILLNCGANCSLMSYKFAR